MREAKNRDTSSFMISLDTKQLGNSYKSHTQNEVNLPPTLLKSKSLNIKRNSDQLESDADQCEEKDILMDSISIIEESNSWMPNNDPVVETRTESKTPGKYRKKYNRKEKSLGELCRKFIYLYGSHSY